MGLGKDINRRWKVSINKHVIGSTFQHRIRPRSPNYGQKSRAMTKRRKIGRKRFLRHGRKLGLAGFGIAAHDFSRQFGGKHFRVAISVHSVVAGTERCAVRLRDWPRTLFDSLESQVSKLRGRTKPDGSPFTHTSQICKGIQLQFL